MNLHSYPKVYALGHAAIADLLYGPVVVEEKIDGSQFSFARVNGELQCRSKNCELYPGAEGMFAPACAFVSTLKLTDGWTYRGEFLAKPKHNCIAYSRIPHGTVILFDVNTGNEEYMSRHFKEQEAARLGMEIVPEMDVDIHDMASLNAALETESCLGGAKIEGVVIKNYNRFCSDGKAMMGKYVSEAFKERNKHSFRAANPQSGDIIADIVSVYRSEARWQKAVGHLRDMGQLTNEPRDIGALIRLAQEDIAEECADEIKDMLWHWAKGKVTRGAVGGLAEWYKQQLAERQFDGSL